MIISNDYKFLFIANPKTGSRTAADILTPYGVLVGEHSTSNIAICKARIINPNFNNSQLEKIYVFWRDPVERFISTVNFLRSNAVGFLIKHRPEWFPGIDLSMYDKCPLPIGVRPTRINVDELSPEIFAAAALITPEQIFSDPQLVQWCGLLRRQSNWITKSETVLDFANFDVNMRIVMDSFGVPIDAVIPTRNVSQKITTVLSPELEAAVRAYYAEDYRLKPLS
ncbi:hypothetical protein UFOVP49_4 [uncultured Caudovirales phage]|uniref:Sulfotransferase family n=1 Tax=uncultured Caudovirales phage TaxID=2100421 RepID=A0A6J5KNV5_9CAUD|nr:hypothetical protein UFOVP49_4 [uncultured Caudovirales phage]